MTSLDGALTIVAVLVVGLPVLCWRIRHAWLQDQSATETHAPVWGEDAQRWATAHDVGPDDQPGANAAAQDALELLWDLPAYGTGDRTTTHHEGDQL